MKKSIYPPYLILFALMLVPVTACTTKAAAEKPQEPPARQEQTITDIRTGDVPAQPAAVETAANSDPSSPQDDASRETLPNNSQETTAKPDAVSGASIDMVSGATVSHGQKEANTPEAVAIEQEDQSTSVKTITPDTVSVPTAVEAPEERTEPTVTAVVRHAEQDSGVAVARNTEETNSEKAADKSVPTETAGEPVPTALASEPSSKTETASETGTAFEPVQTTAAAETPETVADQNLPAYETTLADLITDFERQGGTHNYEPPPTFHEEMLDFFSPQIFTVALSKEPETEPKIKVSRMVAVEEKQRVEITYPGQGWVYVGEQTSQQGLKYEQRKLQDDSSIFMFTAEKRGDYVLHFSYFDVFTNDFITDAVAVSVSAARSTAAKSTVKAPEYQNEAASNTAETEKTAQQTPRQPSSSSSDIAEAVSAVQSQSVQPSSTTPQTAASVSQSNSTETASTEGTVGSVSGTTGNTGGSTGQTLAAAEAEEVLKPDQLLEKARTAIASADAGSALTYLDTFFATAEQKLDEGWFLKGRAYELNGSARNIRLALDAYRTLTGDFPQSKYWAEADARIRYITGFYINIQ